MSAGAVRLLAEAVEEAERVAGRDRLVELFHEDANVIGVDELVDEAAHAHA